MDSLIEQAGIADIAEKVYAGTRLSEGDAVRLYGCRDLHAIGRLADHARRRKVGDIATYVLNLYLNYSNVCILSCQFCAFARKPKQDGAFQYDVDEMVAQAKKAHAEGITEVHMVGGLHPKLPWAYYTEVVSRLKQECPGLWVKAFTAIEIRHLAERIAKKSIRDTLAELKDAGLDSLTGGGAEIFAPDIRDQICRGKETAAQWLEVHREWHNLGMRSTATMLYGHIETHEQRVDHMRQLRALQGETGGFTGFIPFAFEPENNHLSHIQRASAFEDLRNLAIARLYLDNFDHITAYWISMGLPTAQIALSYGVDDLHGTIMQEKIFHMAGAGTPQQQTVAALRKAITEAGREPRQRDTWYRTIEPNSDTATTPQPEPATAG